MSYTFRLSIHYFKQVSVYKNGRFISQRYSNPDDIWCLSLCFEQFGKGIKSETNYFHLKIIRADGRIDEFDYDHKDHRVLGLVSEYMRKYFEKKDYYDYSLHPDRLEWEIFSQVLKSGYIYHPTHAHTLECGEYEKEWLIYESPSFSK